MRLSPTLIVLLIFTNVLVGMGGGVAGYAILSNADSAPARSLRSFLGISDDSPLSVATTKNVVVRETSAVIDAADKAAQSVVSVAVTGTFRDFFGRVQQQEVGQGSGFILTSDGLIVTNRHVVEGEQFTYEVSLPNGDVYPATVLARDPLADLAVLKIDATGLPTAELGSSDALQVGQSVLAVGNALGEFENSVSLGIVSGTGRYLAVDGDGLDDLIQTDAAINPGNSGGPLVNLEGQVVGINTAIASESGGSDGVGFAIPIDAVRTVLDGVRQTGKLVRPYIGVRYQVVTRAIADARGLASAEGIILSSGTNQPAVLPGTPAEAAGLREGDVITQVNGEQVGERASLARRLSRYRPGQQVTVTVIRGSETLQLSITLGTAPAR